MPRNELAPKIGDDLERILDHLVGYEVADVPARIREIIQAISVLEQNPLIGRPVHEDRRELVIGRRLCGYVAVFRCVAEINTVFVLALRHQREAGYSRT